jgi:hypothetical protein
MLGRKLIIPALVMLMNLLELIDFRHKPLFLLLDSMVMHSVMITFLLQLQLGGLCFLSGELRLFQLRAHASHLLA